MILAVWFTTSSCELTPEKVEKKHLPVLNPTSYVFQMPITLLRDTIVELFSVDQQHNNSHLKRVFCYYFPENDTERAHFISFIAETSKTALFGKAYFQNPGTEYDIYLHDFGTAWYSSVYHVKGKPLKFRTAYILQLKSIGKNRTQLKVEAEDPVVINGTAGIGPHGSIAREEKVERTTIEEYALLLFMADKLGYKSMKPLIVPEP